MKRRILVIPREEVEAHFSVNSRQDLKVIAPEILSEELFKILKAKGKDLKPEKPLAGVTWHHSGPGDANEVCQSGDFINALLPQYAQGPFGISFANEKAEQDEHYHQHHLEIYVTDHRITAEYQSIGDTCCEMLTLPKGGILVFAPGVIHKVKLAGLTIIIELPALAQDKCNAKLHNA
jgi:hypothetical protein